MEAEEMDTKEKDTIIRDMYSTLLNHEHGWGCEMETHAICRINSKVSPLILKNIRKSHLAILMENLYKEKKSKLTTITIYINNFPIHSLATPLIKFLNENPNVISILYVTNLCEIRRMSCIFDPHGMVSPKTHETNVTGLKDLMEHSRCVVSAFSHAVWSELISIVGVSKELEFELLDGYTTKFDKNDRSREEEDNRIRSDLVCIRCIPPAFQHQIKL